MLILSTEKRISKVEFCDDATETPDVDFAIIGETKNNLWCAVVSALDVGVYGLIFEAAGAKVNDFDA